MNELIGTTLINGSSCYFVIDCKGNDFLLQRYYDGEFVIASGITLLEGRIHCYWQNGRYFGRNLKAAVDAWEDNKELEEN